MSAPPAGLPIRLHQLLGPDFDPSQYKLHAARRNNRGVNPLDVYARDWSSWVGWNRWREARDEFNRPRIFSMMQMAPASREWVFGGIFYVTGSRKVVKDIGYDVELVRDFTEPLIGRMRLSWTAPPRGRSFKFENSLPTIEVAEVTPLPWAGEPFPGIDRIDQSFRQLAVIVETGRADWRNVLGNMKGVYVWTDIEARKFYIGSATSATAATGGLWSRLSQYIADGHAGNKELRELVDRESMDYVRENFRFALLESWSMRVDDQFVLGRESYWKNVFSTRSHGYNAN